MNINKRIFGDDILPEVKQKLALRQELNKSTDFGEALTNVKSQQYGDPENYARNFPEGTDLSTDKVLADLSSRTPIARIWTALELFYYSPATYDNIES